MKEKSTLRPLAEIQMAHDTLRGFLLGHVPFELPAHWRSAMIANADVLCWVLGHDHNDTFASNLEALRERAEALGFFLEPTEEAPAAVAPATSRGLVGPDGEPRDDEELGREVKAYAAHLGGGAGSVLAAQGLLAAGNVLVGACITVGSDSATLTVSGVRNPDTGQRTEEWEVLIRRRGVVHAPRPDTPERKRGRRVRRP
jgi:hypothetical protein